MNLESVPIGEAKLALVTGANRGIGFEICRQLATRGVRTILGARDEAKGKAAAGKLTAEGLEVLFRPLDVTDPASVRDVKDWVERELGRLDVLINNAAISVERDTPGSVVDMETAHRTIDTNLFGPWMLCQAFIPMMRRQAYGRIVNVSSGKGAFARLKAGQTAYCVSKTALNSLTALLADELQGTNVLINVMTPGWVRTHLGGIHAPRSVEEGADTAVWLATLPDGGPTGRFYRDREEFPW